MSDVTIENGQLRLPRCPHCGIAHPNLTRRWSDLDFEVPFSPGEGEPVGTSTSQWDVFECGSCFSYVLTKSAWLNHPPRGSEPVFGGPLEIYPPLPQVDESVPERAAHYLGQAIESLHAPSGAIMLAASAVDSMLKQRGYVGGSLNSRIDQASQDGLITDEMAAWAHEVRLDANDQRHADQDAALPSKDDAERTVAFAKALAEFLFVLPSKVRRGRGKP